MSTENILVETRGRVGLIRLNRPQALNALNAALMRELGAAVDAFEADDDIGCMVLTGSEKAFAAGADIKEMADKSFTDVYFADFCAAWHRVAAARKPVDRRGCRLRARRRLRARACNATSSSPPTTRNSASRKSSSASFPASAARSGSRTPSARPRRWTSILTGRMMDAAEAERSGLVARVVPLANLLDEALKVAETIAAMSLPSVMAAKEAVNRAFETSLAEGIRFERRIFHALFATRDQKEGMNAFIEKRPAKFENK